MESTNAQRALSIFAQVKRCIPFSAWRRNTLRKNIWGSTEKVFGRDAAYLVNKGAWRAGTRMYAVVNEDSEHHSSTSYATKCPRIDTYSALTWDQTIIRCRLILRVT